MRSHARTRAHTDTQTHTHTHTFQRLSQWNVGQSRVGTKGSVTQLLVPTQSQSFHCYPLMCVCAYVQYVHIKISQWGKNNYACVCVHFYTPFVCTCLRICKCAFALNCWLCVHGSGQLYVNPVIPFQQTTPGLKMDLLELSALLVLARWLCCRWIFFFFCNSQNWFGLISNGFKTSAQYFSFKDLHVVLFHSQMFKEEMQE